MGENVTAEDPAFEIAQSAANAAARHLLGLDQKIPIQPATTWPLMRDFVRANADAPPEAVFLAMRAHPFFSVRSWAGVPMAGRAAITVFRTALLTMDHLIAEEAERQARAAAPAARRRPIPVEERTLRPAPSLNERVNLGKLGKITPATPPPPEPPVPAARKTFSELEARAADPRLRPGYRAPKPDGRPKQK